MNRFVKILRSKEIRDYFMRQVLLVVARYRYLYNSHGTCTSKFARANDVFLPARISGVQLLIGRYRLLPLVISGGIPSTSVEKWPLVSLMILAHIFYLGSFLERDKHSKESLFDFYNISYLSNLLIIFIRFDIF